MNFFGFQEKAKRESLLLLIAFAGVMVVNVLIVNLLAKWMTSGLANSIPAAHLNYFIWGIMAVVWLPVLITCRNRWRDVRNGGHLLAASFGAIYIPEQTKNHKDRELLNVISEMAIASSQDELPCFCLREESSINAFVIGTKEDTVLVVSQGAIERLDRDELQAIIAHEYGHIANNDLTINMRFLVVIGGLNAMNTFGLERFAEASTILHRIKNREKLHENEHLIAVAILWVFGAFFRTLGCLFVFSGDVVKAAFSRKREYLADAYAIQYTRNTWSLASALHKASRKSTDSALHSSYANELDHLCFVGPWKHWLFSGLLASHPSPQSRIELIDPNFVLKEQRKARKSHESVSASLNKAPANFEPVVILGDTPLGVSILPIHELGEQVAIVLSAAVAVSGYDEDTMRKNHEQLLKCYTAQQYPLRLSTEPGFAKSLEEALDALQQQPAAQRKALLEHMQEIVEQDNVALPEEMQMYEHICERLNPPAKAA